MADKTRSIDISEQAFELICRAAVLDQVDFSTCIESMVMYHTEHIKAREYVERMSRIGPDGEAACVPSGSEAGRRPAEQEPNVPGLGVWRFVA
jgi:hypothetical protein